MRVLIIGSPGSGKTCFSERVARELMLPCVHLDDHYWRSNWMRPAPESWEMQLADMLKSENGIIEGNYYPSLQQRLEWATHVIYLDYPVFLCLYRAAKRALVRRYISSQSLPLNIREGEYVPRLRLKVKFIKKILLFKILYKRKILEKVRKNECFLFKLKGPFQESDFFRNFKVASNA